MVDSHYKTIQYNTNQYNTNQYNTIHYLHRIQHIKYKYVTQDSLTLNIP